MAVVRYTKIELARLLKKQLLFRKYLPTLQLKKMLLQLEVNKAREEIKLYEENYLKEKKIVKGHAKLFTDTTPSSLRERLRIKELKLDYENIAGLEVPHLIDIVFQETDSYFMHEPIWVEEMVHMTRLLKKSYEKILVAVRRKELLEKELRVISIRVNLFEKRLIPEIEKDINRIRVFLGDQDLQAIGGAKVSKKKILQRVEGERA